MTLIGITGSFASGKSFVLNYLARFGYKTFSSDEFVGRLYKDSKVQQQIVKLLNLEQFDKRAIATKIYSDEKARIALQNFIHPLVIQELMEFKTRYKAEKLVFAEVPLLFEGGFEKHFDYTITTFCFEKSRLERAKMRNNFNAEIYDKINLIQLSQEEKNKKANFSVNTDMNLLELETEINRVLKMLVEKEKEKWN